MSLDNLSVGKKGIVSGLTAKGAIHRRMLDLGIIKGTKIETLHKSPAGNPTAYFIRGSVIALRNEDAHMIYIIPEE